MKKQNPEHRYNAFISYRHLSPDREVAIRLQNLLEGYRPPRGAPCRNTRRISRVFRDQSELPTSGDLDGDIRAALEHSDYLIMVCSGATLESKWCMEELSYFKELRDGSTDHILVLLVDGEPGEVFPPQLRLETRPGDGQGPGREVEVEPLCADVRANSAVRRMKRLKVEFLRIAAPILGCAFDDLYRRHRRRRRRRLAGFTGTAAAALLAVLLMVSSFAYRTYQSEQTYKLTLAENYTRQGQSLSAEGDPQRAMLYFSQALELAPGDPVARVGAVRSGAGPA